MVNSQVTQEIVKQLSLNVQKENIPQVQPIVDVSFFSRKPLLVLNGSRTTSGTLTVTGPSKIWYVKKIIYSYNKNATCDIASGLSLTSYATSGETNGTITPFNPAVLTTTAERDTICLDFTNPLKLKASTNITQDGTFTAGNLYRSITVYYYEDDTPNA